MLTAFLGFTLVTLSAAGLAAQTDGARGTTPPDRVFPEEPLRRREFLPERWPTPFFADDVVYDLGMRYLPLADSWKFRLDPQRVGLKENWQTTELPDTIRLPGTTDKQQKGSPNTNTKLTNHLSRTFPYQGPAWYQREISISDACKGQRITLLLERTKSTQVWVDGQACGEQDSLAGPQVYDLSAVLTPGKHRLTILVDNGKKLPVNGGHQLAEDTQTNWNGILGRIELQITGRVWIDDVQVYPNVKEHKIKVRVTFGNVSGADAAGSIELKVVSPIQRDKPKLVAPTFAKAAHGMFVEAEYDLGPDAAMWDEFSPNLYQLFVSLRATRAARQVVLDRKQVVFGMREFTTQGTQFAINGKTIFLRGKHDACVFPKTGYAPMDVAGWLSVLRIAKSYGINHYRFHSWCPPEAAFTAADMVGIYLQPKGLIHPDAWREFCSETVPLAILAKYAWTVDETLTAEIKVAHYGPTAITAAKGSWTLAESEGKQIAAGQLPAKDIPQGSLVALGRISAALRDAAAPGKLQLIVQIDETNCKNRYDLWVYPTQVERAPPAGVTVSRKLDDDTWRTLNSGGKVLLLPEPAQLAHAIDGFFASDFWCYPMFKRGNPPGTLGWLCDPKHPALAKFPTEFHSNWQWFHLAIHSRAVILDATPADYRPVVQVIDNFERNHKLGVLWESRVGTGRLLVCSIDLPNLQDQPEARQLLASLLAYAGSDRFQPPQELTVDVLKKLLTANP